MAFYLACWLAAFLCLVAAVLVTAFIYLRMGDGLDLNGGFAEALTALAVSAGQAGGYLLERHLPLPSSPMFNPHGPGAIAAPVFLLCLCGGYKLTHPTTWDALEFVVLGLADAALAFLALVLLT